MVHVPPKTTVNKKEPKADKYIIPFAPELVSMILNGQKVRTYRFGNKYDYLKTGDEVKIQNSSTKEVVAPARVVGKGKVSFGELPVQIEGHETYHDKEHQRKVFSGYYAYIGREISDSDPFLVIEFEATF